MSRKRGKVFIAIAGMILLSWMVFLFMNGPSLPRDFGTAVHFTDGSLMRVYLTRDGRRRYWFPLKRMDSLLVKAAICYEDRRFFYHPGVDPVAVARALWQNISAGRVVSGGSTITLQLVRLLKPGPRTLWRKIEEALWALQLETRLGKRRILEYYLNLAPYGGNVEGVAAASLYYWGRLPTRLTPAEVAFLVSLPQAPVRGKKRSIEARNRVLRRMVHAGLISRREEKKALRTALPRTIHPFPFLAPHAADVVRASHPGYSHIVSTLDPLIQSSIETVAERHRERILTIGATQTSVVVIDNATRGIRALVGSFGFRDTAGQGQVIGFQAPRSPGSALKPFLYALALQKGFITPVTRLEDRPRAFESFRPVNFAPRFRGMVPAKTALALSLNLPFVNLLREVGKETFLSFLGEAGFSWKRDPGLTAITGGVEITLFDLTNLYASLVRQGRFGRPRVVKGEPLKERPWILPGAAYLTVEALKSRAHGVSWKEFDLAWKTGTSFGQRDAWAVGVSPAYTVGVWVGRFDGRGVMGLTGAEAALPVLLDVMRVLGSKPARFSTPREGLVWVKVCPDSGLPAGPYCPDTVMAPFPRGVALPRRCGWHRPFLVERGSGYRACPWKVYRPGELIRKVFLVLPGHAPPPFSPQCRVEEEGGEVRILSPVAATLYLLSRQGPYSRGLPLRGVSSRPGETLYWFVNGKLVAKSISDATLFITPPAGRVEIRVVDEMGHWSRVVSWVDYAAG
ncbi:MAG: penicillin-binding protein 1C [Deltaproteobacteria bacterium]|nr:penicillin-binding protein 1C [Deltaproteobacteria bacterium]